MACGTGQLSVPLSPCVRSWEATDFSAEMIRQAKKQVYSSRLAGLFVPAPFLRPGRHQAALRAGELRCGRDLQRPPCHASPGKGSGGSLAGSEAGGMAVRPHLCLGQKPKRQTPALVGQKPKRQTPALVHGAVRLSGVPCLDCRGADGIPVRVRLFHRSPSASREFVGAAVLSDSQEDPR